MKRTLTLALGVSAVLVGSPGAASAAEVTVTTDKGTQTYWTGFGPERQLAQAQTSTTVTSERAVTTETAVHTQPMSAMHMQAKHLLGATVNDAQGKKVGQIEDIAIDVNGRSQFAVVRLSGDLAAGDRDFTPIPLAALRSTNDKRVYQLTVDRSKLQSASRFNVEQWPATSFTWGPEVYTHYGLSYDAAGAPGANVVVQTGYDTRFEPPFDYSEKSVDNGTAPDGKTTFPFLHEATDRD